MDYFLTVRREELEVYLKKPDVFPVWLVIRDLANKRNIISFDLQYISEVLFGEKASRAYREKLVDAIQELENIGCLNIIEIKHRGSQYVVKYNEPKMNSDFTINISLSDCQKIYKLKNRVDKMALITLYCGIVFCFNRRSGLSAHLKNKVASVSFEYLSNKCGVPLRTIEEYVKILDRNNVIKHSVVKDTKAYYGKLVECKGWKVSFYYRPQDEQLFNEYVKEITKNLKK